MSRSVFVFIQFEFPWALGPADGRYLVRRDGASSPDGEAEPEHVVVLATLAASRLAREPTAAGTGSALPLRLLRGRERSVPAEPQPTPAPTTRVTVIDPVSLSADSQARAWLKELDHMREIEATAAVVNRLVHAHRIAAADPYSHDVSAAQALSIRAGFGEGEQVADGRWQHAQALPVPRPSRAGVSPRLRARRERASALRPQERMAALLGARGVALMCEEVALRAREDLDNGRLAHAALELDRAYALALPELGREERPELAIRVTELAQLRAGVREQAQLVQAQAEQTSEDAQAQLTLDEEVVTHALERLEAALRAYSY